MKNMLFKKILECFLFLKRNIIFFVGVFISTSSLLYSSTLISTPYDGQIKNEVTYLITNNATESEHGLSLNSLEINQFGNSDYWIYSDNKLQNFQMRNIQRADIRSYIFAAYKPNKGHAAFKYNGFETTAILFESKFTQNAFYFDLPLLSGTLARYTEKNSIYITDSFADKILQDNESYDSLINSTLSGETVGANGKSNQIYKVMGVFDTNNNLGKFLNISFGSNLIFIPEYHSFQMNGALYFCGSTNTNENKLMVDFVFDNYKPLKSYSGNLQIGYYLDYKFYDFDKANDSFVLGHSDTSLNSIIYAYTSKSSTLFLVGILLFISNLFILITATYRNRFKIVAHGKITYIFTIWIVSCFSLILNSLLYSKVPIMAIISRQSFNTYSGVTSSLLFLSWLLFLGVLLIIPLIKAAD
jgi:hypothetical protein